MQGYIKNDLEATTQAQIKGLQKDMEWIWESLQAKLAERSLQKVEETIEKKISPKRCTYPRT